MALAVLLLLRPTYLIALAAVLVLGYGLFVRRTAVLVAIIGMLILPLTGIESWKNWGQMIRQAPGALLELRAAGQAQSHPTALELAHRGKFLSLHGFEHDRTFLGLFTSVWPQVLNRRVLLNVNLVLLIVTAAAGLYFAFRLRGTSDPIPRIALVFLLVINIETFGPLRYAYSDVLLALPLILVASSAAVYLMRKNGPWNPPLLILLFGAFIFAALSRIPIGIPPSILSLGRFFATLAALNLFCIGRTFTATRPDLSQELLPEYARVRSC